MGGVAYAAAAAAAVPPPPPVTTVCVRECVLAVVSGLGSDSLRALALPSLLLPQTAKAVGGVML